MVSSEYITMCKQCKEIQELWEPKAGDFLYKEYTERDKEWVKSNNPNGEDPNGFYCHVYDSIEMNLGPMKEDYKRGGLWIPRQEDLQSLLIDSSIVPHTQIHCIWQVLTRIPTGLREKDKINIATLILYMEIKHRKTWNFKTNTWEPV